MLWWVSLAVDSMGLFSSAGIEIPPIYMIMLLELLEVSLNKKYKLERRQMNTKRNQPPRSSSSFQLAENINYSQICRKKKMQISVG